MSSIGDRAIFSGGPEHSPIVEITHETTHPAVRSGQSRRMILIEQDGNEVEISLMTLENIVNWAK